MDFARFLMLMAIFLSCALLYVKARTSAVLLYGSLSAVAVVLFTVYAAPDVALAEASIGLVFTLFLYMVTLQHRGKLWFGLVKVERGIDELETEIMRDYCESHELVLKTMEVDISEVFSLLRSGKIEIAAGAFLQNLNVDGIETSDAFLETKVLELGEPEKGNVSYDAEKALKEYQSGKIKGFRIDLARFISISMDGGKFPNLTGQEKGFRYVFGVVSDEEELLSSLNEHIAKLKESGKLEKMIERILG